nr:hypothetical protein GCM10020063_094720 [Dactylosporangium thailandense]
MRGRWAVSSLFPERGPGTATLAPVAGHGLGADSAGRLFARCGPPVRWFAGAVRLWASLRCFAGGVPIVATVARRFAASRAPSDPGRAGPLAVSSLFPERGPGTATPPPDAGHGLGADSAGRLFAPTRAAIRSGPRPDAGRDGA